MEAKDLPIIELRGVHPNTGKKLSLTLVPYFPDKKMIEPYVILQIGKSIVKVAVRIQELRNSLTVIENAGDMEVEGS
jgi:hypothetical protein